MNADSPERTVLFDSHTRLKARMAPFGGFLMPIQYEGILHEHDATRTRAGLFDTCHMGEFRVEGEKAGSDLERLLTCSVRSLQQGRCRYGLLCNPAGGVIDDLLVYRLQESSFMLVVNAATRASDFTWIRDHLSPGVSAEDVSDGTAKIDLQGPDSPRILSDMLDDPLGDMAYFSFARNRFRGREILVSRTGYTGEIGFEIYSDQDPAPEIWEASIRLGAVPAGLGARDTLRLEMAMPLYGHELSATRNAREAGLAFAFARDKEFIGSDVVLDEAQARHRLAGIRLEGRQAAREGDVVCLESGEEVGTVTSGSYSPSLGAAIALAYILKDVSEQSLVVRTSRHPLKGALCSIPFYKQGTARSAIGDFL